MTDWNKLLSTTGSLAETFGTEWPFCYWGYVYDEKTGWTSAIELRAGDILVLSNGEYVVVEKVQHEILEAPITVYNFGVEDYHTYYVAASADSDLFVVGHNRCTYLYDSYSTGRTEPNSLNEKLAMDSVKSNPWGGRIIQSDLGDPRLLEGTVKMAKDVSWTYGHVDIHYLYHERVGFFDFKYIDNK